MTYYIGVDIGGTNIVAGLVDSSYRILRKKSIKSHAELPFDQIMKNISNLIGDIRSTVDESQSKISSIGIGCPSFINQKSGLLVHANNLNWKNVPIYQTLKKSLDLPIYIKNDADCAAYGEALAGAAKSFDNALMITIGTGLGGGIIINKKIFNGCDHMGAEFGHTKLVFDGVMCTCGRKGCLESYASATALINQTRQAICDNPDSIMNSICEYDLKKVNGATAFIAAKKGDASALNVVDRFSSYLAAGLSSFVCLFRPDIIIIGGGVGNEKEYLIDPLYKKLIYYTYASDVIGVPQVVPAELGNDAGIIGAAMLEFS